ncbi:MAG: prepilin-type N-terminal cleavage/methylation domain-containing protein [Phycisphaerales bacterium]|jgi:prepilin-type N-terminal cleavage/methylation domain-containing protein
MRRRGFTLIEVLVALGLLVVISSLALPVALTNTDGARARTAERILTLAPAVARAEAQRSGVPVALVLAPSEDDQSLSLLVVREPEPGAESAADQRADPSDVSTWPRVDEDRVLPEGTRLWQGQMQRLEAFEERARAQAEAEPAEGSPLELAFTDDEELAPPLGAMDEPAEPVVLAWYLSDGSAMAGEATVVRLADGRVVRVRVEPLVGRLVFTRAPELEERPERPDEPDEAPADASEPDGQDSPERPVRSATTASRFEAPQFERPQFDEFEFDRPEFESRDFDRRGFESRGFESRDFDSREFEQREFEQREFEQREFDDLQFDPLEFDDLGDGDESEESSDEAQAPEPPEQTNPEPPQPRPSQTG